jgi:hypothetical protein
MLACFHIIPYFIIYPFMDFFKVNGPGFYFTVDGDIMPNYPIKLLHSGCFAYIPYLYSINFDEGTDNAFNNDVINTDFNFYTFLLNLTGFNFPPSMVREIMRLYLDDLIVGILLNTSTK